MAPGRPSRGKERDVAADTPMATDGRGGMMMRRCPTCRCSLSTDAFHVGQTSCIECKKAHRSGLRRAAAVAQTANQRPQPVRDSTLDRSLEVRLGWLAGIIDGEGCITASVARRPTTTQLCVGLIIGNTEERIVREAAAIADLCGVRYGLVLRKVAPHRRMKRDLWLIQFQGGKRVEGILEYVLPYLIGKQDQAHLILQIIRRRRSLTQPRPRDARGYILACPVASDTTSLEMARKLAAIKRG